MGSQADNLFYLDPHHAKPAIPIRFPPSARVVAAHERRATAAAATTTDDSDVESGEQKKGYEYHAYQEREGDNKHTRTRVLPPPRPP